MSNRLSEEWETLPKTVVVLPACNEAGTIRDTILETHKHFSVVDQEVEYLVAEDGSTDGTLNVVTHLQTELTGVHVISSTKRKGYPRAARDALLSVGKDVDYIVFMDSDGQYDPQDFWKIRALAEDADIVIGRRLSRAESPLRVFLSTGLGVLERKMFGIKCRDITSAFRMMKTSAAQTLAFRVRYSKYNFWTEFTALAAIAGFTMVEVPVFYRQRKSGKSRVYSRRKLATIALSELYALGRIWLQKNRLRGLRPKNP